MTWRSLSAGQRDENGIDHFHGHPEQGAQLARKIMRRLKMDNATTDAVCGLVKYHDRNPELSKKSGSRANGLPYRKTVLSATVCAEKGSILAQSSYRQQEKLAALAQYESFYREIIKDQECLSLKELAVTGSDLIAAGMKPGKEIGEVLQKLLELVIDDPGKNTKEYLLGYTLENLFI